MVFNEDDYDHRETPVRILTTLNSIYPGVCTSYQNKSPHLALPCDRTTLFAQTDLKTLTILLSYPPECRDLENVYLLTEF